MQLTQGTPNTISRRDLLALCATASFGGGSFLAQAASNADQPLLKNKNESYDAVNRVDVNRLPAVGTYKLPKIFKAPNGDILLSSGASRKIHDVLKGKISIISFIYTYCKDPEGCPLAWRILDQVYEGLQKNQSRLSKNTQMISLSFDPVVDTPEQMRLYGGNRATNPDAKWLFLTTPSVSKLIPLLEGFGQEVRVEVDDTGAPTRTINHMLRMFLVDPNLHVREIYGLSTMSPQTLINDALTLALEAKL